jgi:hypothetical protein
VRRQAHELRYWFEAIDDPGLQAEADVQYFVERSGLPLRNAVEAELIRSLYSAIAAISDIGFDWRNARELPAPAIEAVRPGPSEMRFAPLAQYLSAALVGEVDWSTAEQLAAERLRGKRLRQCRNDLDDLRGFLTDQPYDRFATYDNVGPYTLLIAAPDSEERPDIAHAIGRLGRDGYLDAAGVVWWSAPDPDSSGPVQTYVRGYGPTMPA